MSLLDILSNVKVFLIAYLTDLSETILDGVEAGFVDNVNNNPSNVGNDGETDTGKLGEEVHENLAYRGRSRKRTFGKCERLCD